MDRQIAAVPEVERVFGKIGRARSATDPAPLAMAEVTIQLKDRAQWRAGLTWEALVDELDAQVQIPGMPNLWWMPIQTRTEMLATGIRSPLAIQLSGDDAEALERAGMRLEQLLRGVAGTRSVVSERATGGEFLDVVLDRERAALHGVRAADLEHVVSGVIGGSRVGETVEGRRRFPISLRYQRELRDDFDELERALVSTMSGAQVQLSDVASIERRGGPSMLRSEDGKLVSFVFIDPGARPVEGWVRDAVALMEASWTPPPGVFVSWRGAFEDLERAERRLGLLIPLTLLIVAMLLYWNTGSAVGTALVLTAVPFSLIGAVWIVYMLDFNLSIAVWVGMIALAGLDAETGVVMLLYLDLAVARRARTGAQLSQSQLEDAIVEGAAGRLRPKLMTVTCLICGLAPMMWSDTSGADVMQRIAAPMVGGLVTSFLLELTVIPSLYAMWKGRRVASSDARTG
jgi:Cu(I)/Ag(I) efflux system membrane protein CusA/SilA